MTLYEIDERIRGLFNEDGELADEEAFAGLAMEREAKLENIACFYKNMVSDAAALKAEIDALTIRKKAAERKAETLKALLDRALAGEKFETAKVKVSYRKSKRCEVDDDFIAWAEDNGMDDLLKYTAKPDKTAIALAIAAGRPIEHARVDEVRNLSVK